MADHAHEHQMDLRRGFQAGVSRYGELGLAFDAYADAALASVKRRLAGLGLDETPERISAALQKMAGADLYLARSCEAGAAAAWAALTQEMTPRLEGLARKRGAQGSAPEELVSAMLADLALPPPRAAAQTLIGTYGGAGSLFGWLAVILVRRTAGEARKRKPHSLDNRPADEQDTAEQPGRPATSVDPADEAADREGADLLDQAIRTAWERCTPKERLALLFKYRDGMPQRRMATILRVGEPRVSRLVKQAVAKLAEAVKDLVPEPLRPAAAVAAGRISDSLTTLGAGTPPPDADTDGAEERPAGGPE